VLPPDLRNLRNLRDRALGRAFGRVLDLPEPVMRRLVGPPRRSDRGTPLDLQTQAMLGLSERIRRSPAGQSPRRARAEMEWNSRLVAAPPPPLAEVRDGTLPGPAGPLGYRLYRPRATRGPVPLLVYFHGGGWVIGSLDTHDAPCRMLAAEAHCGVLSVDYRLAPEHRYPAAREDAVAAHRWAREQAAALGFDPERIAVGGDSAGGNLATLVCLEARHRGDPPPAFQLLIYPGTDLTRSCPSHRTFAEGYFLDDATMQWFLDHYLQSPDDARDPRCSPLFERDLGGLAPGLVVTAGFDPLRDEGEAYAARLREAGTPVELHCEETLIHGFFNMGGVIRAADAACRWTAHRLRQALHP
jgi:acetyl esterase